uniref:SGNH hydrolase-type esterase domain-containing protein n=1 Tax=Lactuca sativa TaxID=4236 RepID=A0A9R1W9E1_LACSA|nr:hypothetical protein LSAT_V11C300147190 [Lactuca sativa]
MEKFHFDTFFPSRALANFPYMMEPITLIKLSYSSLWLTIIFFSLIFFGDHGGARMTLPENVIVPAVIAFGDSIVDQGANNNLTTLFKANFSPYGKSTGRFSNNKTPADMIAEELGVKEILPAYDDLSLNDKELLSGGIVGEERTQIILANSLITVVAGSNDIANTYFTLRIRKLHYDIASYTDLMVSSASNFIQSILNWQICFLHLDIYNLGSRRIAIFGAPPLGCLPAQRTLNGGGLRDCVEEQNNAALLYNNKLQSEVEYLNRSHAESKIVYIDIYNSLLDIMQNPNQYVLFSQKFPVLHIRTRSCG